MDKQEVKPNILYVGNDLGYFENLQKRFKKDFASLDIQYSNLYESDPALIQGLAKNVIDQSPDVCFIDLSAHLEEYFHLVRLLLRNNACKKIHFIGLLDLKAPDKLIQEAYMTGIKLCHIKSSELEDVIFNTVSIAFPKNKPEHEFVKAQLNDPINIYESAKIGNITQNTLRIECNRPINSGVTINLKNYWTDNEIIYSNRFMIQNNYSDGLYYNYQYALNLEIGFIDPYQAVEGDDEQYLYQKQLEDEEKIDEAMGNLDKWFEENYENSSPKFIRILVVDKELKLLNSEERTDTSTFMLRLQPYMLEPEREIMRLTPQIIFFEHQRNEEDDQSPENSFNVLKEMVLSAKKIDGYKPYFVVLNVKPEMKDKLRSDFNYENIICDANQVSKDLVHKISALLEAKIKEREPQTDDLPTLYLKKSNPLSICEFIFNAKILSISELDIVFESQIPIPLFSTYRLDIPANFFITVLPKPNTPNGTFYGIIHGISEKEKSRLRKFINSVFFRAKEADREKEREAHKQLQEQGLAKKRMEKATSPDSDE